MNPRVQVWFERETFIKLKSLLESTSSGGRRAALQAFEDENGPFAELLDAIEQAHSNNSNWPDSEGGK